ncbi:hypothetical protein [Pseudonocardia broussonetiae]|uniref:DUF4280 domain-containing protein n=1 Tax=Pseudonocardia broussonetiae TaxID=2736640 RepID=A0A6M6JNS7_9PSEU|nr:hypothetical protein [Pseudonocardia broussonetiae]QJY47961.1 hypothetical protein HOP40_20950 [Pseudonocardia broussonetiae]
MTTGPVVHVGAGVSCSHGGPATVLPGNPRVLVGGQPVATLSDTFMIAGCAFSTPATGPHPCVKIQWLTPAARVLAGGQPLITQGSSGLGLAADQLPQGPPIASAVQPRVVAQ